MVEKKEAVRAVLIGGFICLLLGGVTFILVRTEQRRTTQNNEGSQRSCKQIAEISNASSWKVGSSYDCMVVKDGKLITVKDW